MWDRGVPGNEEKVERFWEEIEKRVIKIKKPRREGRAVDKKTSDRLGLFIKHSVDLGL